MPSSPISQKSDYKWLVFATVAMGSLLPSLDFGSVNIALPTIGDEFGKSITTVQWVTLGYVVVLSTMLLPMGRLSDVYGRKKVYILGFAVFASTSTLAGFSPSLWGIIGLKAASGVGTAMVMANGIAILTTTFPASERGKAVGSHMVILAVGTAMGPVIGGALVEAFGWRSVFFVNLPIAVAGIAAALALLDTDRLSMQGGAEHRGRLDGLGAALSGGAVLSILLGLGNGPRAGWASSEIVAALAIGTGLTGAFVWWERRTASPMLDLSIFQSRIFSVGPLTSFVCYVGAASVWFLMPFYLQGALGYSPGQAGLIMIANVGCTAVTGAMGGWLSDRYGQRRFITAGAAISGAGLFMMSRFSVDSGLGLIVSALALQGCGMGMFVSSNQSAVLGATAASKLGVASAYINLTRNLAQNTGVALATAVVAGTMASMGFEAKLEPGSGAQGAAGAFTEGLTRVYLVSACIFAAAVALTVMVWRQERGTREGDVAKQQMSESGSNPASGAAG
ncbi:MAG: MFS transporter [SAR202 cluster bacterium]|nr:MFS transporter [SAR202 cluster bacterium]